MNPYIEHFNNQEREFDEKFDIDVMGNEINEVFNYRGIYDGGKCFNEDVEDRFLVPIKSFLRTSYLNHLKETRARLEGERKDEEDFDIPQGVNIGEYHFTHSLKREGFNSCLDQEIQLLDEAINYIEKRV